LVFGARAEVLQRDGENECRGSWPSLGFVSWGRPVGGAETDRQEPGSCPSESAYGLPGKLEVIDSA
jgi:hypothetical protein